MKLFGFEITRAKAVPPQSLQGVGAWPWPGSSYWPVISEPFTLAWQRNIMAVSDTATMTSSSAVYACLGGISGDIAKMRIKLSRNNDGIWEEITENQPWLPVLRKPNGWQNRIQFLQDWILSKLLYGNTYVLKGRDQRGIVNAMYVLNPQRVHVLVAEDGGVYYELQPDNLSRVDDQVTVPASEIIHDRMLCLWHPLVGVPPLFACALSATMQNRIQSDSTSFFGNRSMPGGVLTAPGEIHKETAERLKAEFEKNFSGANAGRIAVLGDGLKFEAMRATADVSQLAEQLKFTVDDIGRAFHYPGFKLGGPLPPYAGNTEALIMSYYTDCLQELIEKLELCLDEGLSLPSGIGTEMDLDNLLRMDTAALFESNNKAVGGGWMKPDEARFRANLKKVPGGDSPYLQQQNYSLAALAKRDAQEDPFGTKPAPAPTPTPQPEPEPDEDKTIDREDRQRIYRTHAREAVFAR